MTATAIGSRTKKNTAAVRAPPVELAPAPPGAGVAAEVRRWRLAAAKYREAGFETSARRAAQLMQ